jgi:hypothetical protein
MVLNMPDRRPQPDEYAPHQEMYVSLIEAPVLEALRAQETLIAALPSLISEEQATYRYHPKKWSVREVVGHMADAERVYQYRALTLARGGEPDLRRWDPDGYVAGAAYESRPIADLVSELLHVRRATIPLFANLPEAAWSRSGTLNGKPLTVRALAFVAAGHFQRHLNMLQERYGVRMERPLLMEKPMGNDKDAPEEPHFVEEQGATEEQVEKIDAIVGDEVLGYDGSSRGEHSGQEVTPGKEEMADRLADNRPEQMK